MADGRDPLVGSGARQKNTARWIGVNVRHESMPQREAIKCYQARVLTG